MVMFAPDSEHMGSMALNIVSVTYVSFEFVTTTSGRIPADDGSIVSIFDMETISSVVIRITTN